MIYNIHSKPITWVAFFMVCVFAKTMAQTKVDTLKLPLDYTNSTKAIKINPNTTTVILNNCFKNYCDTLYVFNKKKYSKYLKYKNYILNDESTLLLDSLKNKYQTSLKTQNDIFQQLDSAYNKQSALHKNQMNEVIRVLELNKISVELMRKSLESANQSIQHSQKMIKQKNKKKFFDNARIAGIGVSVGVLIGILVN